MASSAEKLFRLQAKGISAKKKLEKQSTAAGKKAKKWGMWGNIGRGLGTIVGGMAAAAFVPGLAAGAGVSGLLGMMGKKALITGLTTAVGGKLAQGAGVGIASGKTGAGAAKKWMQSDLTYKGPLYKGSQAGVKSDIADMYSGGLKAGRDQSLMAGAMAGLAAGAKTIAGSPTFKKAIGKDSMSWDKLTGPTETPKIKALNKVPAPQVSRLELPNTDKFASLGSDQSSFQFSDQFKSIVKAGKKRQFKEAASAWQGGSIV